MTNRFIRKGYVNREGVESTIREYLDLPPDFKLSDKAWVSIENELTEKVLPAFIGKISEKIANNKRFTGL